MFQLAVTEVVVCWLLWCYPFLKRRFGGPKRESNVLAPQANRGLLLQAVVDAVWHVEFLAFGPAVVPLGKTNLLFTQRLTVRTAGILLVRRAVADMAVDDDQRRPIFGALKCSERASKHLEIVRIAHSSYVPPVADEARGHIFRKGQSSIAFDGDVVVVVNPAEIGEPQMPASDAASPEMPSIMQPSPQSA